MKRVFLFLSFVAVTCSAVMSTAGAAAQPIEPPWRFQLPWKTETSQMTVGGETLRVEVADTNYLRGRGLSYRDGLAPGTGMLFVYNEAQPLTFWMYEMRFCLDIIWIDNGQIRGAAESVCPMPDKSADQLP